MKGDFSRLTFDTHKHYVGVLHQQGRVWLDADWNEDIFNRLQHLQQETSDIIGVCGVPEPGAAFQILPPGPNAGPDDFQISGGAGPLGRCYVNGILCQLDASTSYLSQPDLPNPPRIPMPTPGSAVNAVVYLEVWQRLITYLEDERLREVALGGPDTAARLRTVAQVKVAVIPSTVPITEITGANARTFLPGPGHGTCTTLQPVDTQPEDLCRLPDPANFTGRENHLYRVDIHDGGDVLGSSIGPTVSVKLGQDANPGTVTLSLVSALNSAQIDAVRRWSVLTVTDDNGQAERIPIAAVSANGQLLTLAQPLRSAFTVAQNATVIGVARFKWSRDNAAFAVRITAVSADRKTLTLASLGRDQATALRQGDVVEISDDVSELGPARGHLTYLTAEPDPDQFTVALADPLPTTFVVGRGQAGAMSSPPSPLSPPGLAPVEYHPTLRRWDGQGLAHGVFSETTTPEMNFGDGVHIQFGGSDLRSGDYWQFAARSADGSIEALADASPMGIIRYRCPLAIVQWSLVTPQSPPSSPPRGQNQFALRVVEDCRKVFPPLIDFPRTEAGIHITQVVAIGHAPVRSSTPLANDSDVLVTTMLGGIQIVCDANVDPATISRPTCFLSVEMPVSQSGPPSSPPVPAAQLIGYQPLMLAGQVSVTGSTIIWQPSDSVSQALPGIVAQKPPNDRGILTRLTLKGNFIWAQGNPALFLDGDAFGVRQAGAAITSLDLPSGDQRRGGDFEMWFWLTARPIVPVRLQFDRTSIFGGETSIGTIILNDPAPPGGVIVTLAYLSNVDTATAPVTAPTNVSIAVGNLTGTFAVTANVGAATQTLSVRATLGGVSVETALTVVQPLLFLSDLQFSPTLILVGGTSTGTITLSAVTPRDVSVSLSNSDPNVAPVPGSVVIPANSRTATFVVRGRVAGTTTIRATLVTTTGTTTGSATLTVVDEKFKDKDLADTPSQLMQALETKGPDPESVPSVIRKARDKEIEAIRGAASSGGEPAATSPTPTGGIDGAGQHLATRRAFIRPDERPLLDQAMRHQADQEELL